MTDTMSMDKPQLVEIAKQRMKEHLSMPAWSMREKLSLACRILFQKGHDSGLAGQITGRAEKDGRFYTQQLGLGFDEVTATNLLIVDEHLNVIEGNGMANPANRFHTWIYREHPDVNCIIHTHPLHVSALSMLEKPLNISHMDTCVLYDDIGFLQKWPGVPVGNEEGKLISATLGTKRAALLAHHGLVVACRSVEEACVVALQCERAAELQLLAEAAGEIRDLEQPLARDAHDWILQEKRSQATFHYFARRMLRSLSANDAHPLH